MFGYTTPSELPTTVAYTMEAPLGVSASPPTPWNFPVATRCGRMAPALICVQRPGLQARILHPLCAVNCEVIEEAGMPAGVVQLVPPPGQVGKCTGDTPAFNAFPLRLNRDRHRL